MHIRGGDFKLMQRAAWIERDDRRGGEGGMAILVRPFTVKGCTGIALHRGRGGGK